MVRTVSTCHTGRCQLEKSWFPCERCHELGIAQPLLGGGLKSLTSLWSRMADDLAVQCCTSTTLDKKTVERRVEHEGWSFLTITLPELGKATQKWLDQGKVGHTSDFAKSRGGSCPRFLGGFFSRVFDPGTGLLLDEPCVNSIRAIRQLTLSFGKIYLPCTQAREDRAMRDYVECEQDVRQADAGLSEEDFREFQHVSALLFRKVFTQMERDLHYGQLLPKHGPGSVADKLTSNGKYRQRTWTSRLERVFPLDEYLIPNHHFVGELDQVNVLEPGDELPVRVISVPKTLKTPRIIAVEPTCMQYAQQALLRSFLVAYGRDELLPKLIGFDDQVPNQDLAREGSLDTRTATLDLSEASDRVSNQLVRSMLQRWPLLQEAVDATRSRRAVVRGHGVLRLAKYASMGSALCFPMEAMVFTTLIYLGIAKGLNRTLTSRDVKSFAGSVRVYGDDLIVPVDHVHTIVQTLEHFGARVGLDKSFWTGRFRESCGREYFMGQDVSIVRVRQVLPDTIADATSVISTVKLRNLLYHAGFSSAVEWLDSQLGAMLKHYPEVGPDSPVLGRETCGSTYQVDRMHPTLHSPQVRGYVVHGKPPADKLEGPGALLKCLLKLEQLSPAEPGEFIQEVPGYRSGLARINKYEPSVLDPSGSDKDHLERSGRPKRVGIKLGWYPPF